MKQGVSGCARDQGTDRGIGLPVGCAGAWTGGRTGSFDAMRRLGVLLVGVTLTLDGWSARADAHICPYVSEIPVGRSSTVPVHVTVESTATPDVEVRVPSGLRVENAAAPPGWSFTRNAPVLRFRGPGFPPFSCPSFAIVVTAPSKCAYPISV